MPNWSFEDTLHCPITWGQAFDVVKYAPPWFQTTKGTADYFNQCNDSTVSVPSNFFGFQQAKTGVAYMGMMTLSADYREYISVPLLDTLQSGATYYGSMFISLSCGTTFCGTGVDRIGIYFSNGTPDTTGVYTGVLPFVPQIENPSGNIITDTTNWVKISGSFIANGGENYITIGNFRDAAHTNGIAAYYFIDDVCVTTDSMSCYSSVGIKEPKQSGDVSLFPNPFSNQLTFSLADNEQITVSLYDFLGQQVLQQTFTNSTTINTAQLADGVYYYELRSNKGTLKTGKLVKQ